MRVLLAFLAVLSLMLSPVTASAAMRQCAEQDRAMSVMAHAQGSAAMAAMDCCPQAKPAAHQAPAKPSPAKHDRNSCANACATICLAVAALPASTPVHTVVPLTAQFELGISASLTTHDPPRLERPPRSIA
jgi:cobalamin synthase